jgi:predicted nucleic acid-binding protein
MACTPHVARPELDYTPWPPRLTWQPVFDLVLKEEYPAHKPGVQLHRQLRSLGRSATPDGQLARCPSIETAYLIVMEVLAGARGKVHLRQLRQLLLRCDLLPVQGLADCDAAAGLFRTRREEGETTHRLADCLIAVPGFRVDAPILHQDKDFDTIARHSTVRIA